jgi:hypothetical protein
VTSGGAAYCKTANYIRMKCKSPYLPSLVVGFFGLVAAFCPTAQAAYTATLSQIGPNVFATGSGSLDITDISLYEIAVTFAVVRGSSAVLIFEGGPFDDYRGISGPTNFGSGLQLNASSATGNLAGVAGISGDLFAPAGYTSGTSLGTSTDTWNNTTLSALGLTPGTYVWNWGTGIHADSFTLQIVPEPGTTMLLMLGGVGALAVWRRNRNKYR